MRLERWLHDWDVFLLITLTGLLTGLAVFMATGANLAACRYAASHAHIPARSYAGVCEHP